MPESPEPLFDDGVKGLLQRAVALRRFFARAMSDYGDKELRGRRARFVYHVRWARWHAFAPFVLAHRILLLRRVVFVCVTGSTGKTTTKDLIAAVLSRRFTGRGNMESHNRLRRVAREVLRVRPRDDFAVQEVSAVQFDHKPAMELSLSLLMPRVGVVTNVGTDHWSAFRSAEAVADEKGKLVAALPADGTAILNADDPAVRAMASRARARVILYGTAADADLRAENIRCDWPDRLRFDVVRSGQTHPIQTRLLGTHWAGSVLAAIAAGLAMGIPISEAARAIATVEPAVSRMQPIIRPDGVTFVRDDLKASPASVQSAFEFMANARVERKIIVVGTLSDYPSSLEAVYAAAARQALEVADVVVFVGQWAHKCLTVQQNHPRGHAIYALPSVDAGKDFLAALFRPGDLVLIKANARLDNTEALLEIPAGPADQPAPPPQRTQTARQYLKSWQDLSVRVVAGLGNPGAPYQQTRHNVGFRVLDMLAASLGGQWTETDDAFVATVANGDDELYLVKPNARMNRSGEALARVRARIGFAPEECLLVFDDVSLPVGVTRSRTKGGYGGHQGCRSVIEALATTMVPRIRVGVGRPRDDTDVTDYVLRDFAPDELPKITEACREAVDKIMAVLAR